MKRCLVRSLAAQRRAVGGVSWVERKVQPGPESGIFGNGWDNASLELVFRSVLKRPHIRELLKNHYAWATDDRTLHRVREIGDTCDIVQLQLNADLSDPHRVLKQFSIMDAPVIDIDGKHVNMNGGFVYYDDDGTKIAIVDPNPVEVMAKELLWTLGYSKALSPEPKDARRFLEDIYGDIELPDDVLEPAGFLEDESLLYPEDVWPEAFKGGPRYGKYQRGLGAH